MRDACKFYLSDQSVPNRLLICCIFGNFEILATSAQISSQQCTFLSQWTKNMFSTDCNYLITLPLWIIRSDWAKIFSNQELTSSSPENGLIVGFWIIFKIIIGHMSINEADRLNYSSQSFWRFLHFYSCDRRGSVIQIKDNCRYFFVSFFQVSRLKKQVSSHQIPESQSTLLQTQADAW